MQRELGDVDAGVDVHALRVAGAGVAPVGDVHPLGHLGDAHDGGVVLGRVVERLERVHVELDRAHAGEQRGAGHAQLVEDGAEERLGHGLHDVAGLGHRRGGAGDGGRRVDERDALVGAEEQLVEHLRRVLQRADRLAVLDEVRLLAQLVLAAAERGGDLLHDREVLDAGGGHDHRLGGVADHLAEALEVGRVGLDVVRVGGRHDEVDVREAVAQVRHAGGVGEHAEPALAGLEVVDAHEVRAGPEVRVGAAELHGELAVAVVHVDHLGDGVAGGGDGVARDLDDVVGLDRRAGAVHQDLARLGVRHGHADLGDDRQGGVVDLLALLVGEHLEAALDADDGQVFHGDDSFRGAQEPAGSVDSRKALNAPRPSSICAVVTPE